MAKAHAALTDPVSRANYEKYGHPDGPQGMNVGVALPEWMFTKSKKAAPLMLLLLVGGGVLLPMAFGAWHLLKDQRFSGPNKIMNETFSYLWHSPFKVKELQVREERREKGGGRRAGGKRRSAVGGERGRALLPKAR